MNTILHKELLSEIAKLKRITSTLSVEALVNFVAMEQRNFVTGNQKGEYLSSPQKQGMYLLAIASSQPEPSEIKVISEGKSTQIIKILNSIFNKYAFAYFPEKREQIEGLSEKWHKDRHVAMPAFINHFAGGFKISTDQIKSWISFYYAGFEQKIIVKFGISHEELLAVGDYFESKIMQHFEEMKVVVSRMKEYHAEFVGKMGIDPDAALEEMKNNEELKELTTKLFYGANELYAIDVSEIEEQFGEKVKNSILEHFTTIRGESPEIQYITDMNPVTSKPIMSVDGERLYFVVNNSFYQSIIQNVENELAKGKNSNSFLKARDKRLEEKTIEQFKKVLPADAEFYESAFETNKSHHEHDLVIVHDKNLIIVEAKASPPKEPLRDPSKAFVRINDHFRSNAGIQKAYNQAHALEDNIRKNGVVNLYDKKGNHLRELHLEQFENIYCICITRNDFGALATDLSLLLEKEKESKYPWAINIEDLECMINGFIHLGLTHCDFYKYLDQRAKLHGKVFGTDELEYAGAFLNYGGLEHFIEAKADFIPLDISESNIFDKIYMAILNGEQFTHTPIIPVLQELDRNIFASIKNPIRKQSKAKKDKRKKATKSKRKNRRK
ncbi:hypothetical protein AB4085_03225 [Vibrio cyclitrophicus]